MAGQEIRFNYEIAGTCRQEIENYGPQAVELGTNLQKNCQTLAEYWTGESQVAFQEASNQITEASKQLNEAFQVITQCLQTSAQNFEAADKQSTLQQG